MFSNTQAYVDLGFDVEFVTLDASDYDVPDELRSVTFTRVPAAPSSRTIASRAAYALGRPVRNATDHLYDRAARIRNEARARHALDPTAIHHFEYLRAAAACLGFEGTSVFSMHDDEHRFLVGHRTIRSDVTGRPVAAHERREQRRVAAAQRAVYQRADLVVGIAANECAELRAGGHNNVELLPMSWPRATRVERERAWVDAGILRLLHVGRIDSLPSFRSLQFILADVFPLLSPSVLDRLELVVVGEVRDSERSASIRALASAYPQVSFLGFVEDLRSVYATCDLQVVGSTAATGLRTRIVQSFAFGVPVLSTTVGAEGLEGLSPGDDILLADSDHAFADRLVELTEDPGQLAAVADRARATYDRSFSREVVAERLGAMLRSHALWAPSDH